MTARTRILSALLLSSSLAALSATAGCATGGGHDVQRADPHRLLRSEFQTLVEPTVYEAILRLRPDWLRSRGGGFSERAVASVYVNGLRQDGLEALHYLASDDVEEMQFLHASAATIRFGTNNTGGAILVTTRSGPPGFRFR